jgi:uncharacterized protein (UPF0297 family)
MMKMLIETSKFSYTSGDDELIGECLEALSRTLKEMGY